MQKVYYNRMKTAQRRTRLLFLMLVSAAAAGALAAPQQQPVTKPITASSLDSHEGLTIAADPWLSAERYKQAFAKKSPYTSGILAVKLTIRNDSSDSVKVGIERIRLNLTLDETNRQDLPPLTSEQLADAVLHPHPKTTSRIPVPIPVPSSGGGRDKNWQQYQKLAEDAALHAGVVAPHSTVEGLLYFDLQGQFELLSNARLYVPDLWALEKNQALMYFEIDLSRPGSR